MLKTPQNHQATSTKPTSEPRKAFGVRRIPPLRNESRPKAAGCAALQTLREVRSPRCCSALITIGSLVFEDSLEVGCWNLEFSIRRCRQGCSHHAIKALTVR